MQCLQSEKDMSGWIAELQGPLCGSGYDRTEVRSSLVTKYLRLLPLIGNISVTTENSRALLLESILCPLEFT